MKKLYIKPDIIFESFVSCTSIAAGCDIPGGLHGKESCGYEFGRGEGIVFTDRRSGCLYIKPDGYNDVCYHVPTETTELFNS